jgi:hypothetical protein
VGAVDDDQDQDPVLGGPRAAEPKADVEWKAVVGEEFPTEDVKELVVFALERSFNLPAGDFFRGLLFYYKLELLMSCS